MSCVWVLARPGCSPGYETYTSVSVPASWIGGIPDYHEEMVWVRSVSCDTVIVGYQYIDEYGCRIVSEETVSHHDGYLSLSVVDRVFSALSRVNAFDFDTLLVLHLTHLGMS